MSNEVNFDKTYIQEKLVGKYGDVVIFDGSNEAVLTTFVPPESKRVKLTVYAPDTESRVIVTNGDITLRSDGWYKEYVPTTEFVTSDDYEYIVGSGNKHVFYLPSFGTWVVGINKGGISQTTSIEVDHVGSYDVILSYFNAYIDVVYPDGAECTCSSNNMTLHANSDSGYYRFTVNSSGDWVITTYIGDQVITQTVHISYSGEIVNVDLVPSILNDCSWKTIRAIVQAGIASSYWSIGDCKKIVLNGTLNNIEYTSDVDICAILVDFNHNTEIESESRSTVSFMIGRSGVSNYISGEGIESCIGTINFMNQNAGTLARWNFCNMKETQMPSLFACFSEELQSCILPVTLYTNNGTGAFGSTTNYVFLPSEYEICGFNTKSILDESEMQRQYPYFSIFLGRNIRYSYLNTSSVVNYWTRSCYNGGSSNHAFVYINTSGESNIKQAVGDGTDMYITPIFVIG